MSKITALLVVALVAIIAFFVYKRSIHTPCDELFQQTAPQLKAHVEAIRAKGELALSDPQVQALNEAAQKLGVYLKTCCVLADMGKYNGEQLERCVDKAKELDARISDVAASLDETKSAQQHANPELAQQQVQKVQQAATAASRAEQELAEIAKQRATPTPTATQAPSTPSETPALDGTASGERRIIVSIPFRWCAGGHFTNRAGKSVEIAKGFWIAETELTRAQWAAIVGGSSTGAPNTPKTHVSWYDAKHWCQTAAPSAYLPAGWRFDLPTENQWEYAARAGTTTKYFFGSSAADLKMYAVLGKAAETGSAEQVGRKQPNPWGLYDVYGNVWEWCRDPAPATGQFILRGGGWADHDADSPPGYSDDGSNAHSDSVGFRPVITRE